MINAVEYILRVLQAKKIAFHSYDLASDEDAKRLWRRKAPVGERQVVCTRWPFIRTTNLVHQTSSNYLAYSSAGRVPGWATFSTLAATALANDPPQSFTDL
jgi:hypothetical protein